MDYPLILAYSLINIKVVFLKKLLSNSSIFGVVLPVLCKLNVHILNLVGPFIMFVVCSIHCRCVLKHRQCMKHIVPLCTASGTDSTKDNLVNLLI